jgi:hypothetical protein
VLGAMWLVRRRKANALNEGICPICVAIARFGPGLGEFHDDADR